MLASGSSISPLPTGVSAASATAVPESNASARKPFKVLFICELLTPTELTLAVRCLIEHNPAGDRPLCRPAGAKRRFVPENLRIDFAIAERSPPASRGLGRVEKVAR